MLRIAVCDGVQACADEVAANIKSWAFDRNLNVQVEKFGSGEEVLFGLEEAGDFTAVFIDIELSRMNGLEVAARIREQNRMASIVFVSRHRQYFCRMSEVYPFQYIEKPAPRQKVYEALDHIVEEHRLLHESFFFRYNRRVFSICLGEVFYFVSEKRMIRVYMERGREYVFYEKMDVLEKKVSAYNNCFARIHQSYLVNNRQIEQYSARTVLMRNGDLLPVSRERKRAVGQPGEIIPAQDRKKLH